MSFWFFVNAAVASLIGSFALRPFVQSLSRSGQRGLWARLLAALRLVLVLAALGFGIGGIVLWSSMLTGAVQGFVLILAAALLLPWLANGIAGLWFLSRGRDAGLGDRIEACGQSGHIRSFGVTRVELQADAERSAYLSYWALARSPMRVQKTGRSVGSTLVLEEAEWTEEELRFLRQTAVLAPYRDVNVPVTVETDQGRATVRMALVRSQAESATKRLLVEALRRWRESKDE